MEGAGVAAQAGLRPDDITELEMSIPRGIV